MKRQHPAALLRYTSKNFWLLLIPLLRGLLALKFDFYRWLSGAYLDILVVLLILGMAFFRWKHVRFEIGDTGITFRTGYFVRQDYHIEYSSISSVASERPFLLRPLKLAAVFIDTDARAVSNKPSDPDVKLYLRLGDYLELFGKLPPEKTGVKLTYKASKGKLLFFSFVFSSTLSSLIYLGTLFIQGGKLIDRELEERFRLAVNGVTEIAGRVIKGITPFAAAFIVLAAAGWLYSFISNYLRHMRFTVQRRGENITVENGFFSRRKYYISREKINYADRRQNLLMKIFRVLSVHISCAGYGKNKNEIPVFIPVADEKSVMGVLNMLLPEFNPPEATVNPRWNYIMRFIGAPAALIFLVMFGAFGAVMLAPEWFSVILFAAIMGEILSVYLLFVKFTAYLTNGIGCGDGVLALKYCRFYQFHDVAVPKEKITAVELRQNPFQQRNGSCDFIIYIKGETAKKHKVKGLNLRDAEKVAEQIGCSTNCV